MCNFMVLAEVNVLPEGVFFALFGVSSSREHLAVNTSLMLCSICSKAVCWTALDSINLY